MVAWVPVQILYKLLGPFAKGAAGSILNFAVIAAFVVFGAWFLLDVNLLAIGLELAGELFDAIIGAIADRLTSEVGL